MRKQLINTNSKPGFTIIEVVLVLAIAGLIMMMVFIALPGLQRSQRDTQRKEDLSRLSAAIVQYQGNNRGRLPSNDGVVSMKSNTEEADEATGAKGWAKFYNKYLRANGSDTFNDPSGGPYKLNVTSCTSSKCELNEKQATFDSQDYTIYIYKQARCSGEGEDGGSIEYINGTNKVAIVYTLEGAGIICLDN